MAAIFTIIRVRLLRVYPRLGRLAADPVAAHDALDALFPLSEDADGGDAFFSQARRDKLHRVYGGKTPALHGVIPQTRIHGVDSEEKAALLRTLGADQMLGELYGKPMAERTIKI